MEVGLSSTITSTLSSTQRISALIEKSQERIATGRRVNSPAENPVAFNVATSLSNRASDLLQAKNTLGQGASQVDTALTGLDFAGQFLDQLKAVARQFEASSSTTERANLTDQFNELSNQLDNLVRDASFGGTNLISSSPDSLTLSLNEDGSSSVTVEGQASDSTSLGVDINNVATIDAALSQVRSSAQTIGISASVIDIREDFTQNLVNTLQEGEAKLVQTDLNEEAATALSLQTRGALSTAATGLAAQSEQVILQLF